METLPNLSAPFEIVTNGSGDEARKIRAPRIVIFGPPGAGKTTLLKMLGSFYNTAEHDMCFADRDFHDCMVLADYNLERAIPLMMDDTMARLTARWKQMEPKATFLAAWPSWLKHFPIEGPVYVVYLDTPNDRWKQAILKKPEVVRHMLVGYESTLHWCNCQVPSELWRLQAQCVFNLPVTDEIQTAHRVFNLSRGVLW